MAAGIIARVWPAVAKINLFLHITGRRADGYHLLQTVFQFLDIADELRFEVTDKGPIRRVSGPAGVLANADLTVRAAQLLRDHAGCRMGAEIHLDKRLPVGGGVGGGSSDAATTLVALNALWGCGLDPGQLQELGASLGADVPVFINGHAAWADGVGERLHILELSQPWYLLIKPDVEISTAEIFAAPELTRNCPPITISDFLAGGGTNVCEPVVTHRYPQVSRALEWLRQYGDARLTGTGSCVFAAFEREAYAQRALSQLPQQWRGYVARGLNRSPLTTLSQAAV
ncbi:MAG: 4-(cytidine 5'-diphospho)-2-C-methyl-D-erythritol kinase [Gammaproteobacteria bacterium]